MTPQRPAAEQPIGWVGIVRLGLVQAAIGAIVVLATSTLNRVMTVELAMPAMLPGALVALHYAVQVLRPRLGHGSDLGGRRSPWIAGGMAVLAVGGTGAAAATAVMALHPAIGIVLAIAAFVLIGIGVGAAGTSLLVLLAKRVAPPRRAAAASIVWVTMIAGFVVTAGTASLLLEPFSFERLIDVSAGVSAAALVVSLAAIWGIEGHAPAAARTPAPARPAQATPFRVALAQVWQEKRARHFAIFVFVSMLGYSAQELILEPFGGAVFHLTPGETAKLTSVQHGGALIGMILVALAGSALGGGRLGSLRVWTLGGCAGSAAGLLALALAGFVGPAWPLQTTVFLLGAANGAFAVSAIGAMMGMAGDGRESREGVRMGLWGAAQAVAFALGGMLATIGSDVARHTMGSPVAAYAIVFAAEAALFLVAAQQAARVFQTAPGRHRHVLPDGAAGLSRG